jgi:hypothetical protein
MVFFEHEWSACSCGFWLFSVALTTGVCARLLLLHTRCVCVPGGQDDGGVVVCGAAAALVALEKAQARAREYKQCVCWTPTPLCFFTVSFSLSPGMIRTRRDSIRNEKTGHRWDQNYVLYTYELYTSHSCRVRNCWLDKVCNREQTLGETMLSYHHFPTHHVCKERGWKPLRTYTIERP